MARALMLVGGLLFAAGLAIHLLGRFHIPLGRLPGDFSYRGKHTTFYFPLATCLLLSLVYSLVMWLLRRR